MPPLPRERAAATDGATAPLADFAPSFAYFCNKIGTKQEVGDWLLTDIERKFVDRRGIVDRLSLGSALKN
jgi:hypothetical protein